MPAAARPTRTTLLHSSDRAGDNRNGSNAGLLALALYQGDWLRPVEAWHLMQQTACLGKDRKKLLAFCDFPAVRGRHLRTANVIESVFATVRLRTEKTKGSGTRVACLTMGFKLMSSASRHGRVLGSLGLLSEVIKGAVFVDGIWKEDAA